MLRYIIRRILQFIPVLFAVTLFTFVMMRAIPGGPFDFAGDKSLPPQVVANIEAKYHLDWPLWKQFASYLLGDQMLGEEGPSLGVIRGDLGPSLRYRGQNVNDIIATTLPISAQLGFMSLLLALIIGIPTGTIAALKQNTWMDYTSTFAAVLFLSIPNLVLAPILIWIFSLKLGWFPVATWGASPPFFLGVFPRFSQFNLNYFEHAVLPVFALGTSSAAGIARLTRASLLQVINEDYIRTARSKGLREQTIIAVHALKNSMIPVITILGPAFAGLVVGTFVVELIFGINGMGKHFVSSIGNRDYPVITGVTLIYAIVLVVANLLVDITYAWLDPRIRFD
ncbi:MAG: ABC transporter permease [Anaerolineae bacterium]|jgi:oligopeptide transport system permease protein|nr:ABC transporter permease [Anaerolineae bacterium]MBT4312570.1 ABC transporter permease [Anaerolineae bacterium]MBT4457693.1 ABC transporter permease [Anaerolineae bacterium]MBT4843462.1 ABC transporter permease [Anaerolineae bacterium]MBT6062379.1 ABC transporter permease [Anaerolineae bacterium]